MTRGEVPSAQDAAATARRLSRMGHAALGCLALITARAAQIQLGGNGDHTRALLREASVRVEIPAARGAIVDRHGAFLARDTEAWVISVDSRARPHAAAIAATLARELDWSAPRADAARTQLSELSPSDRRIHDLERGARPADVQRLRAALSPFPMVRLTATLARSYLHGSALFHLLGHLRDGVGVTGIEQLYETTLRAHAGQRREVGAALGRALGVVESSAPRPGRSVRLTVDGAVQSAVERAFERAELASGAAVVLDARSGAVIAAYSRPGVDANEFTHTLPRQRWWQLGFESKSPLLDRFAGRSEHPGFLFTPFTALTALERGSIAEGHEERCGGELWFNSLRFHCPADHGSHLTMSDAFAQRCHAYFFHVAESLPYETLALTARAFGFGQRTELPCTSETAGVAPSRRPGVGVHSEQTAALSLSVGAYSLSATPIQVALAWSALANGGTLLSPSIVAAVADAQGEFAPVPSAPARARGLSTDAARSAVLAALRAVPADADAPSLLGVTARTTPTRDPSRDDAWYAGYFPRETMHYVVVVQAQSASPQSARAIAAVAADATLSNEGTAR